MENPSSEVCMEDGELLSVEGYKGKGEVRACLDQGLTLSRSTFCVARGH